MYVLLGSTSGLSLRVVEEVGSSISSARQDLPTVLFPAIQLVYGCAFELLLAMVYSIQYGLRTLAEMF